MPSFDRSFNSFRASGTNGRLDFSLSGGTSGDPNSLPCKIWSESSVPRLAKESVVPKQRNLFGWMPERTGRWFVGVGRRNPVTRRHSKHRR